MSDASPADMSGKNKEPDKPTGRAIAVIPKVPKSDKYFPAHVVAALYAKIDNPRDRAYIMYHMETGLRVSDVVGTEVIHLDWKEHRTYTYDVKKDSWRFVYWPEKVAQPLKMWLREREIQGIKDKRLFPFTDKTATRILKRWAREVGFPYAALCGTHWCRHTFIRLSRKAGRDIKAVQGNTGDTIRTLLDWYSDLSKEDMQEELEQKPLIKD